MDDLAGFDIHAVQPPLSRWPFGQLRHLDIAQTDDFFARIELERSVNNPWNAAYWVLPLVRLHDGMCPATVWRGGDLDGIGFALCHPDWSRPRTYERVQVDGMLNAASCFVALLGDAVILRLDGEAVGPFSQVERTVRERLNGWIRR